MISVKKFVCNPFQENSYVVYDKESGECVFIDMGCEEQEQEQVKDFLVSNGLTPQLSLHTHLHVDHVIGAGFVYANYGLKPTAHKGDTPIYENTEQYAAQFGLEVKSLPALGDALQDGDSIQVGGCMLQVIHLPGHSPGSVLFYIKEKACVFVGDVLFRESVGRTDLYGGDQSLLIGGIKEKLLTLPADTLVYSGHGPETSIAHEGQYNPFLR